MFKTTDIDSHNSRGQKCKIKMSAGAGITGMGHHAWPKTFLDCRGCPVHCRILNSIPGPPPAWCQEHYAPHFWPKIPPGRPSHPYCSISPQKLVFRLFFLLICAWGQASQLLPAVCRAIPSGVPFLLEFHDLNNNVCWSPREALNNLYIKILHRNRFKTSYPFMTQSIFPVAYAWELCKYLCLHPGYYV